MLKFPKIIIGLFLFILFGCGQNSNQREKNQTNSKSEISIDSSNLKKEQHLDTSNQYIYDFMKIVINEQKLDLKFGLTIQPELGCDLTRNDKVFLKTLLIDKTKKKSDESEIEVIPLFELPKCLTKSDIVEMLLQKEKLSKFVWDNSRLGFDTLNKKNWYCFSLPIFSKDRKKAVMMIRSLCPGLCGTGNTIVFINENNHWTSKMGGQWIH